MVEEEEVVWATVPTTAWQKGHRTLPVVAEEVRYHPRSIFRLVLL